MRKAKIFVFPGVKFKQLSWQSQNMINKNDFGEEYFSTLKYTITYNKYLLI